MKTYPSYQEASKILSAVSYFTQLDSITLETVTKAAIPLVYEPEQLIILEGEPASGLYVIEYGWLKTSKIAIDGREQILQFLGSGEVFNAVSVFTGAPNHTLTITDPDSLTVPAEWKRYWVWRPGEQVLPFNCGQRVTSGQ